MQDLEKGRGCLASEEITLSSHLNEATFLKYQVCYLSQRLYSSALSGHSKGYTNPQHSVSSQTDPG